LERVFQPIALRLCCPNSEADGKNDTAHYKARRLAARRSIGCWRRFGEPEEIGELVLFLCSDACEFMTADTVYANGGSGWR
jgi:NAD(P)-dependent dehydrogenase (short-subunit alcohol dehydrogenase family)